jgi:tetratricopeptide (TPR) repeat protein
MLPISAEGNQPVDDADSTLLEAIAGIRDPYASEELLKTLRSLTPARRRHDEGSQWSSEASSESDLNSLNGPAASLSTALLAIGAQAQLAEFARDAFASQDDTLRHVATVTAARIDVIAPDLGELLIEAVHATAAATRLVAVLALGRHETPSRRAALVHACLSEEDEMICDAAAAEIRGYQGDEGIHDLITHLTQGEPAVRARAADALGRIWDELAVPPLVDALSSGLPRLQISAARALRRLEPSQVDRIIGPLVSIAATEPDAEIRSLAAKELERIPGGTGRLFAPAVEALDAGRYEDALHCLGETTPWITDSADLRRLRALALQRLQRLPEALDDIDAVLLQLPDWADALSFRAELLFTLDRPDEGLTAIREAAGRRPDDADLQAVLGWWSYASGRFDESIHASRHAVELRPDYVGARLNLGLAQLASGHDTLTEQTYRQAIEQAASGDRARGITLLTTALEDVSELEQQAGVPKAIVGAIRSLLQAGVDRVTFSQ